ARKPRTRRRNGLCPLTQPPAGCTGDDAGDVCNVACGERRLPKQQPRKPVDAAADIARCAAAHVPVATAHVLRVEASLAAAVAPADERIAPTGPPGTVVEDSVCDIHD